MNVVSLRPLPTESVPVQLVGRLVSTLPDGQLGVEGEDGTLWSCRRAASCLLKPEPGDTVLLSGPDRLRVYLIAVIEQADTSMSRIDVPGSRSLAANAGTVSIESTADLSLRSGGTLDMQGAQWALKADQAQCHVADMRYTGQSVDGTVGRLRLVGKVFETVAERMVQMARSALRLVDETDQIRAGHLDIRAQESMSMHGKHVIMTGKELMKVDAAQIHMG
jgi:hypothetical protein